MLAKKVTSSTNNHWPIRSQRTGDLSVRGYKQILSILMWRVIVCWPHTKSDCCDHTNIRGWFTLKKTKQFVDEKWATDMFGVRNFLNWNVTGDFFLVMWMISWNFLPTILLVRRVIDVWKFRTQMFNNENSTVHLRLLFNMTRTSLGKKNSFEFIILNFSNVLWK